MQNKITQNVFVSSEKFNKEKEYWQKKLAEITSFGDIPFDFCQQYSRATFNSFSFSIPKDVYEKTKELCNSSIHGMYAVAVTAIGFIIYKYCDIDDVIVGTPIFKQHGCGEFINDILALRCKLKNEMKFKDYLLQTWDEISNSNENMRYPIESVLTPVRTCQKGMALPMFGVLVEFTDIHQKAAELHKRCNLLFRFTTVEGGLTCRIIYRSDIYCNHTIKALHSHFVNYLKVITENPEVILSKIDIIDDGERQRLIHEYNDSAFYYDKEKSIYDYFQEQVQKFPESLAVICEGRSFSYMELNEKATRLAGYLFEKEVNSNSVVAIMMPRTEEMVVAILAVLKAGAVCLPIDTSYPLQRSRYILEDSRTAFILGTDYTEKLIGLPCEFIDYHEGLKEEYEQDNLPICTKAEDGAYIIYTSGTTGKPKGVLLSHRGIINHAYTKIKELDITGEDKVSQNLGINFVASIWQIFAPLFVGARLVVYSGDVVNDPYRLMEKVQEDGVTILEVVPPLLKSYLMLLDNGRERLGLQRMRKLVLTGEKTEAALVNRFYSKYSIPLVNAYGQSECSDDTLHYAIPYSTDTQKVPVGRPSNNTRIYILDRNMRLQPVGLAGEMYISGDGVAKGYINEPELTKERFLENPYESGNVMYKTGDLGRWLPDGNVEYIGRVDQQLKILGYRIEPSEIENCMMSHEWVEAAAVVDKGEGSEDRCIWAYMAAREENAVPEVRKHLEERLPGYMVPAKILQLEKLPLTANGKVDRKALREIGDTVEGREPVAPRNMTEGKIAGIWKELLKLEQVGIDDNFFELGGNSIRCTMLSHSIGKELGVDMKVRDIFRHPTIREMGEYVAKAKRKAYIPIPRAREGKYYPVSPAQRRMFMLNAFGDGQTAYNVTGAVILEGMLDRKRLEKTFEVLVERHEAFRTSFEMVDGQPTQHIHDSVHFCISYLDIGKPEDDNDKENRIKEAMKNFIRPFDLGRASLLRVALINWGTAENIIVYDMHHIISDGASLRILNREFISLYNGQQLPELMVRYRDYAVWQGERLKKEEIEKQGQYWLKIFEGELPVLDIPTDYPRPDVQSFEGDRVEVRLDNVTASGINRIALETGTSIFMVLLAGLKILLSRYSGQEEIIVGSPALGRTHEDVEEIIGMFVNTLAIRSRVDSKESFRGLLGKVKNHVLGAYENQEYPFEELVDRLQLQRNMSRNPLFDVMFIVHHVEEADKVMEGLRLRPYKVETAVSKFDLTFEVIETAEGIDIGIEYSTKLFRKETARKMAEHYLRILQAVIQDMEVRVGDINILAAEEKRQILEEFNRTKAAYPDGKTLYDVFMEQADRTPDKIALESREGRLTYEELRSKSEQLAAWLEENRVKRGDAIGLMADRSADMVTAVLGILRAGAVCVPLDTAYPEKRVRYIAEDSQVRGILQYKSGKHTLAWNDSIEEGLGNKPESTGIEEADSWHKAEDGAYIIYTSGTTGKPKGVLLSHRGIINHAYTKIKELDITGEDKVSQNLGINFVASIWQIFAPLFVGARLVVYSGDVVNDPYRLMEKVQEDGVTILEVVPPLLKSYLMLLDNGRERLGLQRMRKLVLTGEKTEAALVNRFYSKYSIPLVNAYGQSECSDDTLHYAIPYSTDTQKVPVGRPSNNTRIYILDRNMRLQPVGLAGEMYISGDGVAKGYINEPELTKERFLENPYESGNVMYKTGDLGRWLPDGNVEYIGRVDQQLKILGYRIEPSEIENCMMSHEWVEAAAVVDKGEGSEDRCIWAYMAAREENAVPEVRKHLEERLPGYMVPAKILQLEKLPLTANGKVDRKALREIGDTVEGREPVAPRNMTEGKIAGIWKELLKLEQVGIDDNFFELGGNSINAINLVLGLEKIGIKVKVADILKYSTIRTLAIFIEGKADGHLIISIAANGKDPEIKNGIMLEGIKPFNDLFYKNCFYNSLFPVLNYYNLSIMPVLMNDIIFYQFDKAKKDIVTYLPTRNIAEVISDMGIKAVIKTRSESIISDVTSALSAKKPVIIWTDCYYSPIRNDEYKRQHLPHTLLIYGYDQSEKVFYTIEHTKQNSSNYKSRKMYYDDVLSAYDGFQENYNKNMFNSYYDFYYDTDSTQAHKVYNSEEIKNMYRHNHERNREIIYSGLEGIKQFQEYFACICSDKETFFSNVENLIEKVNSAINAKKVEEYRIKSLSNDLKGPVNLIETIIEHWNLIRMNLLRLAHYQRYDKNHLEFYSGLFTQIYSLEHMYINLLELSFNSTKLLFKG